MDGELPSPKRSGKWDRNQEAAVVAADDGIPEKRCVIKCPNCAFENLEGSAYCDNCGDPLGTPGPPPSAAPAATAGAASAATPGTAAAAGRIIAGRYRIERELGGGGQKL